ncbi:type VII secretion protein EccB [Streptomyces sp. NPDC059649]|uniref:type VII secretion protein EccB n=1 Tax=Streptomyces sp. NPDC059649 TaxID=3346895 RepID=UPI0036C0B966
MQTRRDHLQAYQFAMDRLATALVSGDPGRGESPTKRAALSTFFGAGIVLLLCAGFAIYGKLSPVTNDAWRRPGSVLVEKETGNRYLYLRGALRPVRNYASALLLTRSRGRQVVTVSATALAKVPHGSPVGIADAPDTVPSAAALLSGTWTRCLRPDLDGGLAVTFGPGKAVSSFPAGRHALTAAPDGTLYLLWGGTKYRVPSKATLIALGLDGDRPLAAPAAWLASVPTGAPLSAADIAGAGKPAGRVAGKPVTVGQLFTTSAAGTTRSYVMTRGGVASLSPTESALLAAKPGAAAPREVSATDIAAAPVSTDQSLTHRLPDVLDAPAVHRDGQAVCLREEAHGTKLTSAVVIQRGPAATGSRTVLVPPSHGVLAVDRDQLLARAANPQSYLVTDRGIAYRLADSKAAGALGLGGSPTAVPKSLLAALPHGPALDTAAAAHSVKGS